MPPYAFNMVCVFKTDEEAFALPNKILKAGIEPTREILDIASENEKVDFALVLAKILRELTAQTGNIT